MIESQAGFTQAREQLTKFEGLSQNCSETRTRYTRHNWRYYSKAQWM